MRIIPMAVRLVLALAGPALAASTSAKMTGQEQNASGPLPAIIVAAATATTQQARHARGSPSGACGPRHARAGRETMVELLAGRPHALRERNDNGRLSRKWKSHDRRRAHQRMHLQVHDILPFQVAFHSSSPPAPPMSARSLCVAASSICIESSKTTR